MQRSRRRHTRSRTGCLTCKQRHVKCDEKRPICITCSNAKVSCEYSALGLPLRDRRKTWLPGEQEPWAPPPSQSLQIQMPLVASSKADPFNALPSSMPFRSTELFHYFFLAQKPVGHDVDRKNQDYLALTIQNPNAFRSSLLIAALHYTWNAGSLRSYESTFLFHKVDAMQLINEWLGSPSPKLVTTCIREICTLAFAECCLGDVQTADTHIDGLMRMMDLHRPITSVIQPKLGLEDELANRYFLLTYNFVHGVKSRIHDLVGNDFKSIPADIEDLMHKWHVEEKDGLETRLQSMRLFPSFFNVPPDGTNLQLVDGFPFVECLRKFTMMTTLRKQAEMNQGRSFGGRIDQIWLEGAATRLLLVLVGSHANSMYGKKNNTKTEKTPQGKLLVSWSGMTSTIGLYLNEVLGVWNAGQLLENRLHRRVLYILAGDLSRQDCTCEGGDDIVALNFGFWQAFTGALSIAKHRRHGAGSLPTAFESCFRSFIVRWIRKTGITRWDEAKSCLDSVVWPSEHMDEAVELEIWQEAVFEAQQ